MRWGWDAPSQGVGRGTGQALTWSVGAREGGRPGGAGRARRALPPLVSDAGGSLWSGRPWWPNDAVPLGTLGDVREDP